MNITIDQIRAIENLDKIEELYLNELSQMEDNDENRIKIEPMRETILFLKEKYKITPDIRTDYYKYVQAIRDSYIYADQLKKLKSTNEG